MSKVSFSWDESKVFVSEADLSKYSENVSSLHEQLHSKTGKGSKFLGWLNGPKDYSNSKEMQTIKTVAKQIQSDSEIFIVIGIGGSYLGSRAVVEMLQHSFYNLLTKDKRKTPKIFFVGNHISSTYLTELLEVMEGHDVSVNVISKSGTTTEPAIAFRAMQEWLEDKYGKEKAAKRIYVTTDENKGALKILANQEGYQTFVVPDDVGGRYSVLTAVGILPLAVAGIDIDELLSGAAESANDLKNPNLLENDAYLYAVIRNILYKQGKRIEILAYYEPSASFFAEWWKQLFGESEGKEGKGLFPVSVGFTTDLHSMGQYIQEGQRNIFETSLFIEKPRNTYVIKENQHDLDGLNYLAGKTMDYVNCKALEGTTLAHTKGNVPNMIIKCPELTPYHVGYLIYFFMKACAMSGYILNVNPFDQPGVEEYKNNMFALLGKPGFEDRKLI